ncbi:eukaryotic translation initiation factor 3 subunit J-A-like [Asterias amurensis]|uniref:eukaryotic translation initiation factor 3 subunit J-A-like n=1 Tax=Asterias amurensis TaxID=7602 RepID=UPI003AB35058
MADWESEDFDPDQGFVKPVATDRWDGEDEEPDVKDTWEDSDSEKKEAPTGTETTAKATQVKKKKSLEATLKAKEEKRKKELEKRRLQAEQDKLSPEEQIAEKLRQQKLQEESDLQLARETFGVSADDNSSRLDSINPTTEEEFQELGKLLQEKLQPLEKSPHYVDMLDALFQACSLSLEADQVKRLGTSLTAIANEKAKAQKNVKAKKKSKKAVLAGSGKAGKGPGMDDEYNTYGNDMDDFM